METTGGENSAARHSAKSNDEILSLAATMYALDESQRLLLTDELDRRSIGPDEIQSYIDAKQEESCETDVNPGIFSRIWLRIVSTIWPSIVDTKTAA